MRLNYKQFGDGDPVIILHGLLGMLDNWQSLARRLGEGYHVHILDARNHGRSPHQMAMNYPLMAEDVIGFMDEHGFSDAHLIGHSMGGKTVMQVALDHPERVRSLVPIDIAPKAYPPGHLEILSALSNANLGQNASRASIQEQLVAELGDLRVVLFLMKNIARADGGGYKWRMNLDSIKSNYDLIIGNVTGEEAYTGPVLFLKGADSGYIKDDDLEEILEIFPMAKLQTVPQSGHWLHADQPEIVLASLQTFLDEH